MTAVALSGTSMPGVIGAGKPGDACPQPPGIGLGIDDGCGEVALEAREDFAIQAAPILLGAFLQPRVKVLRDVPEDQVAGSTRDVHGIAAGHAPSPLAFAPRQSSRS